MNTDAKKILKITCLALFFIFIVSYAFFSSKDLVFGVKIRNIQVNSQNIIDGERITDSVVKITGNAKNAISLTLNGREISIDQKGNFNESLAFLSGYNIINLKAQDKFGNSDEKNYKLMYVAGNAF